MNECAHTLTHVHLTHTPDNPWVWRQVEGSHANHTRTLSCALLNVFTHTHTHTHRGITHQ